MTPDDFLDVLAERKSVSTGVIAQLRQKVRQGDHRITSKSLLKFLVKKELIDRDEAKRLLETSLIVSPGAESSILGLVPLPKRPNQPPATPPAEPPAPIRRPAREEEPIALMPAEELPAAPGGLESLPGDRSLFSSAGLDDAAAGHDPLLEAEGGAGADGSSGKKKRSRKKRDRRRQNEWDSPLILLGFGGLASLLIAGAVIWYLLFRENADKLLQDAGRLFDAGSYSQAITQYEKFVADFPRHSDVSQARVRLEMSKLWRDTTGRSDFTTALATAQATTAAIQDEPAFSSEGESGGGSLSQAKSELSELLAKIATGLAAQAEQATEPAEIRQLIDSSKSAVGLCMNTKFVPQRLRLDSELESVRESLERVQRRLTRNEDLAQTIAAMDAAIKAADPAAAFTAHKELLATYPMLVTDEQLGAKVREVSAAEQALVKFTAEPRAAETAERPAPLAAAIALAERLSSAGPSGETGAIAVRIDGVLYGLSASDGTLLWRRSVGVGGTAFAGPDDLQIAVDSLHQEVVAVDGSSGKLAWRQPLGEALGQGALRDATLLVPGASGKLYVLDAVSGELRGHVQFSQPIRIPPAFSPRGDRVYVVGDYSNLYTLDAQTLSCLGVYFVGHAKGSVQAPPLPVLNKVLVAENAGVETCQLHVVGLDKRQAAMQPVTVLRLKGPVVTPLLSAGRRFAALTTLGEVAVYEAGAGDDAAAITQLAKRDANLAASIAPFGMLVEGTQESHLWVAAGNLQKFAVQPTGNRLPVRTLPRDYPGDVFDQALLRTGEVLIHVRRPQNGGGAIVEALDRDTDKTLWETRLAAPAAGAPAVDPQGLRISAASSAGGVYLLDRQSLGRRVQDRPLRAEGPGGQVALDELVDLGGGRMVAGAVGAKTLLLFRPDAPRDSLLPLPLPAALACEPIPWGEGVVVPTQIGQVFWLSAVDGGQLAAPFQPRMEPGQDVAWLAPTAVPGSELRFAISDGAKKLYLVGVQGVGAQAALAVAAEVELGEASLETPLAAIAGRIVAGDSQGNLAAFDAATLAPAEPTSLGGRITWGPFPLGPPGGAAEAVLAALDSGEVVAISPTAGVAWRQQVAGQLGGRPLVEGDGVWLLDVEGRLIRLALKDGQESVRIELDEPAVFGPVPFGPRLVVAGSDGALLVVNRP